MRGWQRLASSLEDGPLLKNLFFRALLDAELNSNNLVPVCFRSLFSQVLLLVMARR